jgi:cation transport ATPase
LGLIANEPELQTRMTVNSYDANEREYKTRIDVDAMNANEREHIRNDSRIDSRQFALNDIRDDSRTTVYLIDQNKNILGAIVLEDEIREESKMAVEEPHKFGLKVFMITGDKKEASERVARELGIDEYFAEVLP